MTAFAISYDLHKVRNYGPLIEALKKQGAVKALESMWLMSTTWSSSQVRDWVQKFVDDDDSYIVIQIGPDWASRNLSKEAIDWLRANL